MANRIIEVIVSEAEVEAAMVKTGLANGVDAVRRLALDGLRDAGVLGATRQGAAAPTPDPTEARQAAAATPEAVTAAADQSVNLSTVEGTGEGGAITEADVNEAATPEAPAATPAAEAHAAETGVDLSTVEGTGADGKITKADVEAAAAPEAEAAPA